MNRSKQVENLHSSQTRLWYRLEELIPELLGIERVNDEEDVKLTMITKEVEEDSFDLEHFADDDIVENLEAIADEVRWLENEYITHPDSEYIYYEGRLLSVIKSLRIAVGHHDIESVLGALSEIDRHSDLMPHLVNLDVFGKIQDLSSELDIVTPRLFYSGGEEEIQKPGRELIYEVSSTLTHQIARNPTLLHKLTPREFEEFIAELFAGFGYHVQLTARTRDGGRDVIAVRSDRGILSKLLIECKHFAPTRTVGLSYVRELYAIKTIEKATKAILATTSYFSRDARLLESQLVYELELKDYEAIVSWARQYSESLQRIRRGL